MHILKTLEECLQKIISKQLEENLKKLNSELTLPDIEKDKNKKKEKDKNRKGQKQVLVDATPAYALVQGYKRIFIAASVYLCTVLHGSFLFCNPNS